MTLGDDVVVVVAVHFAVNVATFVHNNRRLHRQDQVLKNIARNVREALRMLSERSEGGFGP